MHLEKGDFYRGCVRIQTPVGVFQLEHNTKLWQAFTRYPVNASENGDLNRCHMIFLTERFKDRLEWQRKLKGHGRT